MIKLNGFVIYIGTLAWGWRMYGFGWKTTWFLGFSIVHKPYEIVK